MVVALVLSWATKSVEGYSTEVGAGKVECFIVATMVGTTITGNFEVLDDATEHIAVTVKDPAGKVEYETRFSGKGAVDRRNSEGTFDFDAQADGDYTMCIENGTPTNNDGLSRTVGFNFREMDLTDEGDLGGTEYVIAVPPSLCPLFYCHHCHD
jgi:hypothetical protein